MIRVWTNSWRGGVLALLSFWALALTATLALLAPATPAWAHTALVDTQPGRDSVVTEPVTAVTLRFTEVVSEPYTTVVVTGPDGRSLVAGQPRVVGDTVTQPVGPLPEGQIRVAWRTVSNDGHPAAGEFTFTVSARAAATPASPPATSAEASAPSDAAPPGEVAAPSGVARPGEVAPAGSGPDRSLPWPLAAGSTAALALVVGLLWRRRRARASGATTGGHPAR